MQSNKRSADDWPASITKRPATSEQVNLLIPETPNNLMLNCLRESTEDIIEYVTKEAVKMKEFNALNKERKDEIFSSISKVIHKRYHDIILNKVVNSGEDTTLLYYKTYPKKGLDEEILGMLLDSPINPSTIFYSHIIDESIEKCFRKIFTDLKSYEDENILHDELPSVEVMEDKIDEVDKNLDRNVDVERKEREKRKEIEEANNKVLDVNEQDRKKLDTYYKMIDKLITPKIVDLLNHHRSEFQEILKNNKEYSEEEATIKLQLRDEIEKSLKEENKQEIENYLSNKNYNYEERDSENYDEVNSETDRLNREMCLDNDEVDREIISENDSVDSEMNSENVNINEENTENDNMNEENSENDNINEENSENNNMNEDNSVIDDSQTERDRDKLVQSNANVNRPDPEYRVKLISMPDMPTKELMLEFLNPFNTKTIKKHKTIKNLLIINLNTEEDYNNILKASGTIIGYQKLLISSESNNSNVNKNNKTPTVDRSHERSEVETAKEPNNKTNADRYKNNDIRKEVQDTRNEREGNSEIEVTKEKVIVKQEPDELINDRIVKVKNEIDSGKEIVEREVNVNTSHVVNTDASEFVAWVNASPFFPKQIAAFIKGYNPTAIKKHKKVPNVVLVTFKNKSDYEIFLTMDGHQINSGVMSINITVMKDPRVKENHSSVAKEQSNLKENEAKDVSNAEDIKFSIKVLDSQNTVSTSNTMNEDEIKPKVSTNIKFVTVKTVTAINREHEIDKVSNVNIQVLDKNNDIDTGYRIKRNKNSNSEKTYSNSHLDNIVETNKKDSDISIKNELDHNVIKIEEDIVGIKEESSDKGEEDNSQVDLNNEIIKVEDDIVTVDDNSSEDSGDILRIMDIEQFDLTSDSNDSVEIICENDREEYNGDLKDVINKKITETFSKMGQRNKETNFELLNCKELEEESEQTQDIESDENTINSNAQTKLIEKTFHNELNVLSESIFTMLNEDEEYVTIKSIVTDNTKSLYQSSKKNS